LRLGLALPSNKQLLPGCSVQAKSAAKQGRPRRQVSNRFLRFHGLPQFLFSVLTGRGGNPPVLSLVFIATPFATRAARLAYGSGLRGGIGAKKPTRPFGCKALWRRLV